MANQMTTAERPIQPLALSTFPLFRHMLDEYGLTLLESELAAIVDVVEQMKPKDPAK